MNSLKTVVMVAFLAAVGYVVYVSITKNPRQSIEVGVAPAWPDSSKPELLGPGAQKGSSGDAKPANPSGGFGGLPFGLGGGNKAAAAPTPPSSATAGGMTAPTATLPGTPAAVLPSDPRVIAPPSASGISRSTLPVALPSAGATPRYPEPSTSASYTAVTPADAIGTAVLPGGAPAFDAVMFAQFNSLMASVRAKLDEGKLDEGLVALSPLYGIAELPPAQSREVNLLLGQVAGSVIYSRNHYLPPYRVQAGETLEQIAQKYNVPAELLARVNGINDPAALQPGQELKVIKGPFEAVVNLSRYELVLKLDGRYAGRFPIGIGRDNPKLEGVYTVLDKIPNPNYPLPGGSYLPGTDPSNPLGGYAIDLGNGIAIHGTNNLKAVGRDDNRGTICLGQRDIDDVFNILSIGSRVEIRR